MVIIIIICNNIDRNNIKIGEIIKIIEIRIMIIIIIKKNLNLEYFSFREVPQEARIKKDIIKYIIEKRVDRIASLQRFYLISII